MQRLRGIDSMFVSLESSTNLLHVGAIAVLDPSTAPAGGPPPVEALRAVLAARLDRLPSLRRRLAPVPGGLQHPRWVGAVPDLGLHVRHRAIPRPGGEHELAAYAADVLGTPLDRSRPLWQLDVLEGLQDGMVAVVAKIHHSVGDAAAGSVVTRELLDWEPLAPPSAPTSMPVDVAEPDPGPLALLGEAFLETTRLAVPVCRLVLRTVGALTGGIPGRLVPRPPGTGGHRTPRTSLGGRMSLDRVAAVTRVDRADVERVRRLAGVGTGDVVLALTGTALRTHLTERGELPGEPLVAFVPAAPAMGDDDGHGRASAGRLPGMLVPLATTVADPAVRLVAVAEAARRARELRGALPTTLLDDLAELTVPAVLQPAARMARVVGLPVRRPPFNVMVASLPGPRVPVYCAGSEVVAYHPFGPVVDGAGLSVTAVSYRDQVGFGLLGCREAVPDIDTLAARIPEALRELTKALTGGSRRRWPEARRVGTQAAGEATRRSTSATLVVPRPGR